MSIASKLRRFNRVELAAFIFFIIAGIILLVYLPITGFPPQLGLLGILSLFSAYGMLTKRGWMPWLVFVLLASVTAFTIFTLVSVGFSDALFGISMIVYVALSWVLSAYILLKKR